MVRKSKLITAPANNPVSCEDMKLWLKQDDDSDDFLIESLIASATELCEVQTGKALMTQTWEKYLDFFPENGTIYLNKSPLQTVNSIKYYDNNGDLQTLSTDVYAVDDQDEDRARIFLKYNQTYPNTYDQYNSIIINYSCGFGPDQSDIPKSLTTAIKLTVANWYENREAVTMNNYKELPLAVQSLYSVNKTIDFS